MSPSLPSSVRAIEELARRRMPPELFDAMFGPPGLGKRSSAANQAAFEALRLRPRVATGTTDRLTSTRVLGDEVALPVLLAPTGSQRRAHPAAEIASTRAAGTASTVMTLSIGASCGLEEIAAEATGPLWFQLYVLRDAGLQRDFVERAEAVGCRALVLTVDLVGVHSTERAELYGESLDDRTSYGCFADLPEDRRPTPADIHSFFASSVSWADVEAFCAATSLPVVVKGIQTGEDARMAVEAGARAVVVSNHGGHALDAARPTIHALPEVVDAVGDDIEIYVDGGVRRGSDVLKACAVGARAVLVGRAVYWGLAVGGEAGVAHVLAVLHRELATAMAATGLGDIQAADRSLLAVRGRPGGGPPGEGPPGRGRGRGEVADLLRSLLQRVDELSARLDRLAGPSD